MSRPGESSNWSGAIEGSMIDKVFIHYCSLDFALYFTFMRIGSSLSFSINFGPRISWETVDFILSRKTYLSPSLWKICHEDRPMSLVLTLVQNPAAFCLKGYSWVNYWKAACRFTIDHNLFRSWVFVCGKIFVNSNITFFYLIQIE